MAKKVINQFSYELNDKTISKGYFKIYQAKSGKIMLLMGNSYTELALKQIQDLGISCYELEDFSHEDFKKAYGLLV